jgi:hypothetical protein
MAAPERLFHFRRIVGITNIGSLHDLYFWEWPSAIWVRSQSGGAQRSAR